MVAIDRISKRFGDVIALSDFSMTLSKGDITVLLGPNGAGKTTLARVITGALNPDSGSVGVFGVEPASADGESVRSRCGVVSAKPSLYDRLDGRSNLTYAAELYNIDPAEIEDRVMAAARLFDIDDSLGHKVGGYSTGMKTRLALARATLHSPDLLLLDEPTSGLDPESAQAVLELVRGMTEGGKTVLMCTHLLSEAEGLADEIVIMESGSNLISGTQTQLAARYWPNQVVKIETASGPDLDRIERYRGVVSYERTDQIASVGIDDRSRIAEIVKQLSADSVAIHSVIPQVRSLESVYFAARKEFREQGSSLPSVGLADSPPPEHVTAPTELNHLAQGLPVAETPENRQLSTSSINEKYETAEPTKTR